MYEDSDIELKAFKPGGRIFCIASAGCTALRLAPQYDVVAVDINPVQLDYARRRFQGHPGYRGRAEKIMDVMRVLGPLAGWAPSRVREFLDLENPGEQKVFWEKRLNTRRFRWALDLIFSVTALRRFYAPGFLNFLPQHLGRVMRGRMERCFKLHPNKSNAYARSLLMGEWPNNPIPPEARNIESIEGDAADILEKASPGSFNGFTLSNILDGASAAYQARLFAAVRRAAAPGANTVLRSFSDRESGRPGDLAPEDRSLLWGSVLVRPVADLPL